MTTGVSDLVSRYGLEAMGLAYAVVGDMVGFKSVDRPYSNRESDDWDTRIAAVLMKEDRCWYSSLTARELEEREADVAEVSAPTADTHYRDFLVSAAACLRDPDFARYYREI